MWKYLDYIKQQKSYTRILLNNIFYTAYITKYRQNINLTNELQKLQGIYKIVHY